MMIEPGSPVGEPQGFKAEEVMDRALEPNRRRMNPADGGKPSILTWIGGDADLPRRFTEERHVH
jgi:hypothetical protein